jgi:hypothetical protein
MSFRSLTHFPQTSTEFFIVIEHSCKLITVVKDPHQPQELFWGYGGINLVVSQQVVGRLDQEQLKHAFDDNLFENATTVTQ